MLAAIWHSCFFEWVRGLLALGVSALTGWWSIHSSFMAAPKLVLKLREGMPVPRTQYIHDNWSELS
jgi:hypothetical protein